MTAQDFQGIAAAAWFSLRPLTLAEVTPCPEDTQAAPRKGPRANSHVPCPAPPRGGPLPQPSLLIGLQPQPVAWLRRHGDLEPVPAKSPPPCPAQPLTLKQSSGPLWLPLPVLGQLALHRRITNADTSHFLGA